MNIGDIFIKHRALIHRSPSPHNTQPWTIELLENKIAIGFDSHRVLKVTDPTLRDLCLCLGMFIESIAVVVGEETGKALDIQYRSENDLFAVCDLSISSKSYDPKITSEDLRNRSTNRKLFQIPNEQNSLSEIGSILKSTGAQYIVHNSEPIADLLDQADLIQMSDTESSVELNQWLRAERRLISKDGLSSVALDLKYYEALLLKLIFSRQAHLVLKNLGIAKFLLKSRPNLLTNGPLVIAFTINSPWHSFDVIETGRLLMRAWCELCRNGYSIHPLSQLLDVVEVKTDLEDLMGIGTSSEILFIVRIGYASTHTGRSRRLIE